MEIKNPKTVGSIHDFLKRSLWAYFYERAGNPFLGAEKLKSMHSGETCFILGNGPSLNEVSVDDLKHYPTFGTNGIFIKHEPTYYVTIAQDFYKNHKEKIRDLHCTAKFLPLFIKDAIGIDSEEFLLNCAWNLYGTYRGFHFPVPLRFSKDASRVVYLGGSVLFVCLQLAYWMGFRRVILLGVDHHFGFPREEAVYGGRRITIGEEDTVHFNKQYSPIGYNPHCDMIAIERSFELALKAFRKSGREIVNASKGSRLNVIPKITLESAIESQ